MAKIQDKLYNRIIEGELLEISDEEISKLGLAKASDIPSEVGTKLYQHTLTIKDSEDTTRVFYIIHYRKDKIGTQGVDTDDMCATALNIQDTNNYQCLYDFDNSTFYAFGSGSFTIAGDIASVISDEVAPLE